MASRRCLYCGCTEDRACAVPIATITDPRIREAHERYARMVAEHGIVTPATIGCWWVQLDPPVCSAPACVARLEAAQAFDETTGDASRVVVGQGVV